MSKSIKLFLILSLVCSQITSVRARPSWAPVGLAAGAAVTGVGAGVAHWYQKRLARKHAENIARHILAPAGDAQKLEKKRGFIERASQVLGVSSAVLLAAAGITAWAQRDKGNALGADPAERDVSATQGVRTRRRVRAVRASAIGDVSLDPRFPGAGDVVGEPTESTVGEREGNPEDEPAEESATASDTDQADPDKTSGEEQEDGQESDHELVSPENKKRAQEIRDAGARIVSAYRKSVERKSTKSLRDEERENFLRKRKAAIQIQKMARGKRDRDYVNRIRRPQEYKKIVVYSFGIPQTVEVPVEQEELPDEHIRKNRENKISEESSAILSDLESIDAAIAQKNSDIKDLQERIVAGIKRITQSKAFEEKSKITLCNLYNKRTESLKKREYQYHRNMIDYYQNIVTSNVDKEALVQTVTQLIKRDMVRLSHAKTILGEDVNALYKLYGGQAVRLGTALKAKNK